MPIEHIIVDGSNIATEGRSTPSLAQLENAVSELKKDHPRAVVTVIVDATFSHRIEPSELGRFEGAVLRGEYVHPPAGAIGRGDAFLLRVAEKVDGTVLSNDSFQEFHGEHPWLFERGRLLGATPVPGIGWIFTPRQPVRGPRSHQAVRESEQARKQVTKAIAAATKEVVGSGATQAAPRAEKAAGRRSAAGAPSEGQARPPDGKPTPAALNDPLVFISFIAEHRLGDGLEGEVESYTSHGAVVRVGEMRCYVPVANLGDPPPRSARDVLKRGEHLRFVLTALDPHRRGAELALPGIAQVSGHPSAETVAAEVRLSKPSRKPASGRAVAEKAPAGAAPAKKLAEVAAPAETTKPAAAKRAKKAGTAKAPAAAAKKSAAPSRSTKKSAEAPVGASRATKAAAKRGPTAARPTRAPKGQAPETQAERSPTGGDRRAAPAKKARAKASPPEPVVKAPRKRTPALRAAAR